MRENDFLSQLTSLIMREKVIHKPTKNDKGNCWMVDSGSTWSYRHGHAEKVEVSIVFGLLDRDMHVCIIRCRLVTRRARWEWLFQTTLVGWGFSVGARARSRWKEGIARQLYIEVRGTIGLDKHANTLSLWSWWYYQNDQDNFNLSLSFSSPHRKFHDCLLTLSQ